MAGERLTGASLVESVWLDRRKYEQSEASFQELMAQQHAQLEVVGKAVKSDHSNDVAELIGKTQSMIQEKLRSVAAKTPSTVVALEQRVAKLEREKAELEKRVSALEKRFDSQRPVTEPPVQEPKQNKDEEEDDDFDLFGSDEEDDEEAERLKQERLAKYAEKKAAKPAVIAKSSIVLEVKPWDDETDMAKMEKCVRSIEADGLVWRASKLVPVGYGISKLQIICIIEDDKISTDFLEEEITSFDDLVQSVDIAAFNKI